MIDKIFNSISLAGWMYLHFNIGLQLFLNKELYLESDITTSVFVLQAVQLFQTTDILLILLGKSKGSIVGGFFQILGRNFVSLFMINNDTDKLFFAIVVVCWSMADINRYLYYLFKDKITGFLRYNSFLILYPLGVYG